MEESRGLESYNGDDVIPFQRTVIKQMRADKGKFPSFSPHLPQSLGNFDLAKMYGCMDTVIIHAGDSVGPADTGSSPAGQVQSVAAGSVLYLTDSWGPHLVVCCLCP